MINLLLTIILATSGLEFYNQPTFIPIESVSQKIKDFIRTDRISGIEEWNRQECEIAQHLVQIPLCCEANQRTDFFKEMAATIASRISFLSPKAEQNTDGKTEYYEEGDCFYYFD